VAEPRDEPLLFLNRHEADTIEALAGRIVPGDAESPGAREAGAVHYVDRALAGFLRNLQGLYRQGLRELDRHCGERHGRTFATLGEEEQDALLVELERRAREDPDDRLGHLFAVVREHVVQGFFCDPAYGGNRGMAGWRAVGFPGARWGYSAEEMQRDFDATRIPLTALADLYASGDSAA
jgi:gluconate 2-dehydrogenase gamma chain